MDCDNYIHITCGQNNDCVLEVENERKRLKFIAYCNEHKPAKSDPKKRISCSLVRETLEESEPKIEPDQCNQMMSTLKDGIEDDDAYIDVINISAIFEDIDATETSKSNSDASNSNTNNNNESNASLPHSPYIANVTDSLGINAKEYEIISDASDVPDNTNNASNDNEKSDDRLEESASKIGEMELPDIQSI